MFTMQRKSAAADFLVFLKNTGCPAKTDQSIYSISLSQLLETVDIIVEKIP